MLGLIQVTAIVSVAFKDVGAQVCGELASEFRFLQKSAAREGRKKKRKKG